jgi:sigma-B regulation protein RsbU (phosphoserine phosphatase)
VLPNFSPALVCKFHVCPAPTGNSVVQEILIAEDDAVTRHLLESNLEDWGYKVLATENGAEAWEQLQQETSPRLAILDWMMPLMSGVEVCQQVRAQSNYPYTYIILLTGNTTRQDLAAGFAAGADDYIFKPFDETVLHARINAGERILNLEQTLASKIVELETALTQVKQLKELLPICMFCKKIRDDNDYWHQIEAYLHQHTGTDFSHGICPDCFSRRHEMFQPAPNL